ncbi:DNA-binding protein [Aquabacterium sp.]|uniref:DNA-binding protein n=1 Tax=Aquabacterium sp. TaxID=1872578 RepID=UPI0035C6BDCE
MSKPRTKVATSVISGVRNGEQAKAWVYSQGMTLRQFAETHRLTFRVVSEVIRGVNKGLYGEGHRAAKALGMK